MLSSLQALSLIEPPLPRNLPDACLLCCSTLKTTSHALDNMHNRRAAHAPAAAAQPALYAVQPLSPALGSLSSSSAKCSPPPEHAAGAAPSSYASLSSLSGSMSWISQDSPFVPRLQMTWVELKALMQRRVGQPGDVPQHASQSSPVNNLHTMVRAPHNNPVKDKQRSKWMSSASQNAAAMLPSLASLLDDGRARELTPLSPSFFHKPDADPNNIAHLLRQCTPVQNAARGPSSPSKAYAAHASREFGSLSRVEFSDALPPLVLQAAQPVFSSSLAGAAAPHFIACLGAALRRSQTPTRFYFIVYFEKNGAPVDSGDSVSASLGRVAAVACYWITTAFDMAR